MLEAFDTQFWCDVVGALIHSVWQAAVIALLLSLVLRQISAKKATLRYWISVSAIVGLVLTSFFTYHVRSEFRNLAITPIAQQPMAIASSSSVSSSPVAVLGAASSLPTNTGFSINWTALAALFWVIGVSVMVLRMISAVLSGNHLSSVTPIESSKHLELLKDLSEKLGLNRVPSFWSSATSHTPYAVGFLAPAIVVPLSMLTNLSATELQAVLAHELAHVKRNDYLANLFQMVIEAVYFFNPAVWWISRQIRAEREACCDQVAIESASNQIGYATILANWMESIAGGSGSPTDDAPASALAFADKQSSGMLERIQRILKPDSKPRLRVSPMNWILVVAVSIIIAGAINVGSKAVATVAVQVLSDSERIAKIEEKKGEVEKHANGVFEEGKTTIKGRIVTEDGGEVVGGRIHTASRNVSGSCHGSAGGFEADKEFKVSVDSGVVWLNFSCKNYAPAVVGPIAAVKDQTVTYDVTLVKGKPHLIHVVDEAGQPISGAELWMNPKSHGGAIWKKNTDDRGDYTFQHRNPGKQSDLHVGKAGYLWHESVVTNDGKTEVTLKAAPVSKGLVLSADGAPVADAELYILYTKRPGSCSFTGDEEAIATTDQQGKFETSLLSAGASYGVLAVSDLGMGIESDVTISDDINFKLRPPCTMDVTIKGDLDQLSRWRRGKLRIDYYQRVGQAHWYGNQKNGGLEIVEETQELIRLKLKRLLPGAFSLRSGNFEPTLEATPGNQSVEITASAKDNESLPKLAALKLEFQCEGKIIKPSGSIIIGNRSHDIKNGVLEANLKAGQKYLRPDGMIGFAFDSQDIKIVAGEANEFTIEVSPAGAVSGNVVDANGEPVTARVSCWFEVRRENSSTSSGLANHFRSDSKGNFLLTPIPLGAKVTVRAGDRFNPAISEELFLEQGKSVAEVQLKVAKPVTEKVRVVDPDGNPIPGAELSIGLLDPKGASWSGGIFTDDKGEAEISPMHPTWLYNVTAETIKGFVKGTTEMVRGEVTVLQLDPSYEVSGRVLDRDGQPAPNKSIHVQAVDAEALNGSPSVYWATSEAEGKFKLPNLPDAEFRIKVDGAEPVIVDPSVVDGPIEVQIEAP